MFAKQGEKKNSWTGFKNMKMGQKTFFPPAVHKLVLTGYQLTKNSFASPLQNLLKAHGWLNDERT